MWHQTPHWAMIWALWFFFRRLYRRATSSTSSLGTPCLRQMSLWTCSRTASLSVAQLFSVLRPCRRSSVAETFNCPWRVLSLAMLLIFYQSGLSLGLRALLLSSSDYDRWPRRTYTIDTPAWTVGSSVKYPCLKSDTIDNFDSWRSAELHELSFGSGSHFRTYFLSNQPFLLVMCPPWF